MDCEQSRLHLPALLDDDLDETLKNSVTSHLKQCSHCQKELKELQKTVELLKRWEAPPAEALILPLRVKSSFWEKHGLNYFRNIKPKYVFAMFVVFLFGILFLKGMEFRYQRGEFTLTIGNSRYESQDRTTLNEKFLAWQRETLLEMSQMIIANEERKQKAYQIELTRILMNLQEQRWRDLQYYTSTLEHLNQNNEQTRYILEKLVRVNLEKAQ